MTIRIETGPGWEVRLCEAGDLEHGLPSLATGSIDHMIFDPPYSKRTHGGQKASRADPAEFRGRSNAARRDPSKRSKHGSSGSWTSEVGLGYAHLEPADVQWFAREARRITTQWIAVMCDHILAPHWEGADDRGATGPGIAGECATTMKPRYVFAPIPIVIPGMNVRLAGDGPSSWAVYMIVSRPRIKKKWGTKPGAYRCTEDERVTHVVKGTKPLSVMLQIVADYTAPGEMILDPTCGSGTTGVAAIKLGRRFLGFERDPIAFDLTVDRLRKSREQRALYERAISQRASVVDRHDDATLDLPGTRCMHVHTERGPDVPRRHGSWASEVCVQCDAFRTMAHPIVAADGRTNDPEHVGKWKVGPIAKHIADLVADNDV